jgi:thiol-disulfide isomerase/thioredoxin
MSNRQIITELNVEKLIALQTSMGNGLFIIKFGADWCGPCKKIAPTYKKFINVSTENILFADIDVDENLDLYMALKKHKMVQGIPVFLAFYGNTDRDKWYIPDDSVIGADEKAVNDFFQRCQKKATSFIPYTYYT